ncbi:hypothetical protein MRS44_003599 [Fusarium solani]|uniref:uncharacterized protein n=1 Tax=Fusarium solani TaxID=169388 RepID=UPI0032C4A857|nr:hypothetical protein MRS44_003599 [Fusarium solani]
MANIFAALQPNNPVSLHLAEGNQSVALDVIPGRAINPVTREGTRTGNQDCIHCRREGSSRDALGSLVAAIRTAVASSIHQGWHSNKKHVAFGADHVAVGRLLLPPVSGASWLVDVRRPASVNRHKRSCMLCFCMPLKQRRDALILRHDPRMNSQIIHRKHSGQSVYHQEIGIRLHGTGRASSGVLDPEPARNQRQISAPRAL